MASNNFEHATGGSEGPRTLFYDNTSAITMTKYLVFHRKTKHIGIRYHFIQEIMEKRKIELQFCKTEDQLAQIYIQSQFRERNLLIFGSRLE